MTVDRAESEFRHGHPGLEGLLLYASVQGQYVALVGLDVRLLDNLYPARNFCINLRTPPGLGWRARAWRPDRVPCSGPCVEWIIITQFSPR